MRYLIGTMFVLLVCAGCSSPEHFDEEFYACQEECPEGSYAVGRSGAAECNGEAEELADARGTYGICGTGDCGAVLCRLNQICPCGLKEAGATECASCEVETPVPVEEICDRGARTCGDGFVTICSWVGQPEDVPCPPEWTCEAPLNELTTCFPPEVVVVEDPFVRVVTGPASLPATATQSPPAFAGVSTNLGSGFSVEAGGFSVRNAELVWAGNGDTIAVCGADGCEASVGWSMPLSKTEYCAAQDACVGASADCEGMDIQFGFDYARFAAMSPPVLDCVYDLMQTPALCPLPNISGCPRADQLTAFGPAITTADVMDRTVSSPNGRWVGHEMRIGGVRTLAITDAQTRQTQSWTLQDIQSSHHLEISDNGLLVALVGSQAPFVMHAVSLGGSLTSSMIAAPEAGNWYLDQMRVSPSGDALALAWREPRKMVSVYNRGEADYARHIELASEPIAFSPVNGQLVTYATVEQGVEVWDLEASAYVRRVQPANNQAQRIGVGFDPSGTRLLTWSSGTTDTLEFWTLSDLAAPMAIDHGVTGMPGARPAVRFTPSGNAILLENTARKMWWTAR